MFPSDKKRAEEQAWRDALKPGDEFYDVGHAWAGPTIGTVDRVTPTQVIDASGRRFAKKNGFEIGAHGLRHNRIEMLTPSLRTKCERAALCQWFGNLKPQSLSLPHLRAMYRAYQDIELNK